MSGAAFSWFWNASFGFEDAVVENLFIVLHYCDRCEWKIVNVKLVPVVKYCND